ncbi:MAG: SDR family oxidoreductase [Asgard group archaeon]|nr:SDR family oxidoreductase [Asgard group archaeon]
MKNILITGSSRGLGLEFTKQYLEKGENVIASCRNPMKASELQDLKSRFPNNLTVIQLNVTEEEDRDRVFEQVKTKFESLDVLINNAGIVSGEEGKIFNLGEVYKEDFSKVFLVNSIAPLLMSEKFLPLLEKGEKSKIINITSLNGCIAKRAQGGKYSYCTSKAALNMITKILSNDLRDKGIVVLVIHPGWIKTDMGGPNAPQEIEEPISMIIDLVEKSDLSQSGKFLDWKGNELPW